MEEEKEGGWLVLPSPDLGRPSVVHFLDFVDTKIRIYRCHTNGKKVCSSGHTSLVTFHFLDAPLPHPWSPFSSAALLPPPPNNVFVFVLFLPLFLFSNFVVASSRVIAVFAPAELLFHVSHFSLL